MKVSSSQEIASIAGLARLRVSKQSNAERENAEGVLLGRKWAFESANYGELERVAKIDISDEVREKDLAKAILGNSDAYGEPGILVSIFDTKEPSLDMVAGFIDGAVEVFNEV